MILIEVLDDLLTSKLTSWGLWIHQRLMKVKTLSGKLRISFQRVQGNWWPLVFSRIIGCHLTVISCMSKEKFWETWLQENILAFKTNMDLFKRPWFYHSRFFYYVYNYIWHRQIYLLYKPWDTNSRCKVLLSQVV